MRVTEVQTCQQCCRTTTVCEKRTPLPSLFISAPFSSSAKKITIPSLSQLRERHTVNPDKGWQIVVQQYIHSMLVNSKHSSIYVSARPQQTPRAEGYDAPVSVSCCAYLSRECRT